MPFDATPWDLPVVYQLDAAGQILVRARDKIARGGWTVGKFQRGNTYCAVGAIIASEITYVNNWTEMTEAQRIAYHRLKLAIGRPMLPVPFWNDYWARDAKEVIAAFDRAIDYRL